MEFRDTDLRTSVGKPSSEDELLGRQKAFKDGTKVYITLPGGKREAFTFKPTLDPTFRLAAAIGKNPAALVYRPAFVGDKGVTSTLTIISDRSGASGFTTKYTYDRFGNKLTEQDALEKVTIYTYGENSRLLTETDALGRTTTNTYSRSGNLRFTLDALGKVTEYGYRLNGELSSVTDALGKVTEFDYYPTDLD